MADPRDAAAPEGGHLRGGAQIKAGGPDDILPHKSTDAVAVNLATMPPRERAAWLSGYETGWVHRMAREHADYTQAIEDIAARYVRLIALDEEIERSLASTLRRGRYADVADARGEHARADRQRRTLAERGVWPVAS